MRQYTRLGFEPDLLVTGKQEMTEHTPLHVKEGFGNQITLCWTRGLNPGPSAQKSDNLPLLALLYMEVVIPRDYNLATVTLSQT
ncbi:unnamed protein product [Timema podura]|uniref:Uncharacterized protein n=1 Tax=Timema podura TaxID=61482 RepID=A0ABN7NTR1_TIMPD|nr:unnamed protein product [Timema podura]